MLKDLKGTDGPVELLTGLDVVQSDFKSAIAQADEFGRGKRRCIADGFAERLCYGAAPGKFLGRSCRKRKLTHRTAVGLHALFDGTPVCSGLGQGQNRTIGPPGHNKETM